MAILQHDPVTAPRSKAYNRGRAMAGGLHYTLGCSECGSPILIHEQTLAQVFASQADRARGKELLGAVCSGCKHVRTYDVGAPSPNRPWGPVVALDQTSDWDYVGWLPCEVETCEARLPLFAPVSRPISSKEWNEYVATWNWDGLTCPAGHKIPEPPPETPEV